MNTAQPEKFEAAQSVDTVQTQVAQPTDAAAQLAAAYYTVPTPVAQSTDPLYTATLFQAPQKTLAAQTATPNRAEVARKLSGSFSEAAGKPPLSPRVINMMEQSTEIVMHMSKMRNRGETKGKWNAREMRLLTNSIGCKS